MTLYHTISQAGVPTTFCLIYTSYNVRVVFISPHHCYLVKQWCNLHGDRLELSIHTVQGKKNKMVLKYVRDPGS